jgi:indolepyruvate ferredoxin oxidoreductase alpha subunit
MEWIVLPVNVVARHRRLHARLEAAQTRSERSLLNTEQGDGRLGVIAAGYMYQKLFDLLDGVRSPSLSVFGLATTYPLPALRVGAFLKRVEAALVLEETAPVVERAVRAQAQLSGTETPVYGRDTGHLPGVGEVSGSDIAQALSLVHPALSLPEVRDATRSMPSRVALCAGCPYIPTFEALLDAIEQHGGREQAIVVGDPGCMVRAQLSPFHLLDVKYSLGSSISTAAGFAAGQQLATGRRKHVIALCGDSGLLHTGINGLIDAARLGVSMLTVVLDNGTTALTGGQPHPGSATNLRGAQRPPVDLVALARAAGAPVVGAVESTEVGPLRRAFAQGMSEEGLAVVIVRGRCPQHEGARAPSG